MISDLLHALNLYFGRLVYRDLILSDDDLALLPTVPVVVVVVLSRNW